MSLPITFDESFKVLIGHEGGYVDDPTDPGGETKYGISKRAYPDIDIKNLTLEDAKKIYLEDYWEKGGTHKLPNELKHLHFDGCVNHGVNRAIKLLQKASGCKDDGIFGPITTSKAWLCSLERLALERLYFYCEIVRNKNSQARFIGGWKNRIKEIVESKHES